MDVPRGTSVPQSKIDSVVLARQLVSVIRSKEKTEGESIGNRKFLTGDCGIYRWIVSRIRRHFQKKNWGSMEASKDRLKRRKPHRKSRKKTD